MEEVVFTPATVPLSKSAPLPKVEKAGQIAALPTAASVEVEILPPPPPVASVPR